MFSYIYLSAIILPLIGIILMYNGAYGISVGEQGYDNGSLSIFLLYTVVSIFVFFMLKKRTATSIQLTKIRPFKFYRYCFRVLILISFLVGVMLFVFNADRVWYGEIGKGEFRASLGSFGFFAYLTTKYIAPLSLAYAAFLYKSSNRGLSEASLLAVLFVLGMVLGSTWGFKATGITIILPAFLILLWSSSFINIVFFSTISLSVILLFAFIFDGSQSLMSAFSSIFLRLTVIQGDVAWYVWGLYETGVELPPYGQTLAAALGDTVLENIFSFDKSNYNEWISIHYDMLLNDVAGVPQSVAQAGHSIVGTPFTEGVIMGGAGGVLFMAVLSGGLSAIVFNRIDRSLAMGNGLLCAFWATYFSVFLFPWLRGGAVVQLFHISLILSFSASIFLVFLMAKLTVLEKKSDRCKA